MYRSISDYALIGDCQSAALVSAAGSIDWLCLPYFDSPALFLRLLDDQKGGYCSIEPTDQAVRNSRRYLPGTNILESTFETRTGTLLATDFMPIRARSESTSLGQDTEAEERVIRILSCTAGEVQLTVRIAPTFSYAENIPCLVFATEWSLLAKGRQDALQIDFEGQSVRPEGDGAASASVRLRAGERCALVLTWCRPDHRLPPQGLAEALQALERTRGYWQRWSGSLSYEGDYRDSILRSALALKLMTFEPTGAMVAAPTTSLPEVIGGERNWDYRFTWLRDATFTLIALMNLGYFGEARDFLHFLHRAGETGGRLQVLYTIHGEDKIQERDLPALDGYRGSRPVRAGNAAVTQTQLDIFGELIHCIYLYVGHPEIHLSPDFAAEFWPVLQSAAEYVARHWREPDNGIWEMRGAARQFVYSKGSCWLALDRALRLARYFGFHTTSHSGTSPIPGRPRADFGHWARERDALYDSFNREGFNPQVGAFVQCYGATEMDASALRLPMMGILDANDPRMRSTITQIEKQLMRNGLVCRYRGKDGLCGIEGAFAACGFWLVYNYALSGRLQDADHLFRHLTSFANDVGLLSEEIDPDSRELLGNFPQALTHIALINAGIRLADARRGRKTAAHAVAEEGTTLPRRAA